MEIDQSTGYSKGAMYLNDLQQGERVAILDDVLSRNSITPTEFHA